MSFIRFIRSLVDAVKDPERDFTERIFLILTFVTELTVAVAFAGDLFTHENPLEIAVLASALIAVPVIVLVCWRFDKLKIAILMIIISMILIMLPVLFFFGGGMEGGGVIWFIFGFMYVGLLVSGKWRNIMFALIALETLGCVVAAYYRPDLVYEHSRGMQYIDFFRSLILVGILCFIMTWAQARLLREEKERAQKEAERAEELTRSQNRFFSNMSHEIRTPINSILGLNELILRDPGASDDIVRDATGIQGSGKMLLSLINDILDFSKIEAGSMDVVPVDYRVGNMLSDIVNMIWIRAQEKDLGFEVSVDPGVPAVLYGDEVRIKQVIVNLLNNAVKYTQKGHLELRVESRDVDENTVELLISVSDTGMGIKKEDIPFLFDSFKRVDEGKNRHIEGTGLGLSIVKQLVELMEGTITVDSIYGEGSTFMVTLRQAVSDHNGIGELNIHNQRMGHRSKYESSFMAPEVRILIVDDNEMNLEVEKRLLEDTDMIIETVTSGREALDKALKVHYDAIFMDHLMPGMDGIECLEALRNQDGGLNRTTPVIVLTANAGSDNQDLYHRSGFDGYLVKPVSGETMEKTLLRHIPPEKVIRKATMMSEDEEIHTSENYADKAPVIITSSSMCDLPGAVISKLRIPIIPFMVRTDQGVFEDGVHLDANELIRHIAAGKAAESSPPSEAEYTEFFADALRKAHHVIHIAITTSMSEEYKTACEAAQSFENVSVINSGCLSSSTGILVLIACKLAQQGIPVQDIISELEVMKHRIKCSFIIDTTEYMAKKGLVSHGLHRIADTLSLHPSLRIREDKASIGGVWMGRTKGAYRRYIKKALPPDTIPDSDIVFITYADMPEETLIWIEEEIRRTAYFEHVVFQQASAAISSNCGPGSFGVLYFLKSNKSYNIASYIDDVKVSEEMSGPADDAYEDTEAEAAEPYEDTEAEAAEHDTTETGRTEENAVSEGLEHIDIEAAIQNSGSEETFRSVLRIFYDSIPVKYGELETFHTQKDWENYTIKIHALKSSARLIGALDLGSEAELLEKAGKEGNYGYIEENHGSVMDDYMVIRDELALYFGEPAASDMPMADEFLMESVYEGLREAAESEDPDMIDEIMQEIAGYAIPESESDRFSLIREKAGASDFAGILEALGD